MACNITPEMQFLKFFLFNLIGYLQHNAYGYQASISKLQYSVAKVGGS